MTKAKQTQAKFNFKHAAQSQGEPLEKSPTRACCEVVQRLENVYQAFQDGKVSGQWVEKNVTDIIKSFPSVLVADQRAELGDLAAKIHQSLVIASAKDPSFNRAESASSVLKNFTELVSKVSELGKTPSSADLHTLSSLGKALHEGLKGKVDILPDGAKERIRTTTSEVNREIEAKLLVTGSLPGRDVGQKEGAPAKEGKHASGDQKTEKAHRDASSAKEVKVEKSIQRSSEKLEAKFADRPGANPIKSRDGASTGKSEGQSSRATEIRPASSPRNASQPFSNGVSVQRSGASARSVASPSQNSAAPASAGDARAGNVGGYQNRQAVQHATSRQGGAVSPGRGSQATPYASTPRPPANEAVSQKPAAQSSTVGPAVGGVGAVSPVSRVANLPWRGSGERQVRVSTGPQAQPELRLRGAQASKYSGEAQAARVGRVARQQAEVRTKSDVVRNGAQRIVGRHGVRAKSSQGRADLNDFGGTRRSLRRGVGADTQRLRDGRQGSAARAISRQVLLKIRLFRQRQLVNREGKVVKAVRGARGTQQTLKNAGRKQGAALRGSERAKNSTKTASPSVARLQRVVSLLGHLRARTARELKQIKPNSYDRPGEMKSALAIRIRAQKIIEKVQSRPLKALAKLTEAAPIAKNSARMRSTPVLSVRESLARREVRMYVRLLERRLQSFVQSRSLLYKRLTTEFTLADLERLISILGGNRALRGLRRKHKAGELSRVEEGDISNSFMSALATAADRMGGASDSGGGSDDANPSSEAGVSESTEETTASETFLVADGTTPTTTLTTVLVKEDT